MRRTRVTDYKLGIETIHVTRTHKLHEIQIYHIMADCAVNSFFYTIFSFHLFFHFIIFNGKNLFSLIYMCGERTHAALIDINTFTNTLRNW